MARRPVEVLIDNAGNVRAGHLEDIPADDVRAVIEPDLAAPLLLTGLALPHLRAAAAERGSLVLNVSSGIALTGLPFYTVYAATTSGIARFGQALRRGPHGSRVHVATAYPGATVTDMMSSSTAGEDLGFGHRPVEEVVDETITGLENGKHEINTAVAAGRKMQELNAPGTRWPWTPRWPRAAMEDAVRHHRSV